MVYRTSKSYFFISSNSAQGLKNVMLTFTVRIFLFWLLFICLSYQAFSQINFRGQATSGTISGSTIVVGKPIGTVAGDVMIANISTNGNNVVSSSAGWTLLKNVNSGTSPTASVSTILYKVVNSSDVPVTNYTFALGTGANGAAAAIVSFSGLDTIRPIDTTSATFNVGNSRLPIAAGVTTLTPKTAILMLGQIGRAHV